MKDDQSIKLLEDVAVIKASVEGLPERIDRLERFNDNIRGGFWLCTKAGGWLVGFSGLIYIVIEVTKNLS